MAERSNAAVLKTVDCYRSGGSNPSLSAKNKYYIKEIQKGNKFQAILILIPLLRHRGWHVKKIFLSFLRDFVDVLQIIQIPTPLLVVMHFELSCVSKFRPLENTNQLAKTT